MPSLTPARLVKCEVVVLTSVLPRAIVTAPLPARRPSAATTMRPAPTLTLSRKLVALLVLTISPRELAWSTPETPSTLTTPRFKLPPLESQTSRGTIVVPMSTRLGGARPENERYLLVEKKFWNGNVCQVPLPIAPEVLSVTVPVVPICACVGTFGSTMPPLPAVIARLLPLLPRSMPRTPTVALPV